MLVLIAGTKIELGYKVIYGSSFIVDDLLDNDETVLDFKKKYNIKSNINRFTDVIEVTDD